MEDQANVESDDSVSEGGYETALEDFADEITEQPSRMAPVVADEDVLVKVSTEGMEALTRLLSRLAYNFPHRPAATNFVESYYPALQSARHTIASFYIKPSTMQGGKALPTIIMNGNTVESGAAVQEIFEKQMPAARYEVQSFDCHILNPCYLPPEATQSDNKSGKQCTLLALVSGVVTFGTPREDPQRGFSETFVLVPNNDQSGPRGRGAKRKDFLIQSQNFRHVS